MSPVVVSAGGPAGGGPARRPGTATAERRQTSFEQDAAKRTPEVLVEHGVDDGVEHRVHVAQPEGDGEGLLRDVAEGAEGREDVEQEEGQPARNERAHDEPQDERGPLLLLARQPPLLPLRVALDRPRRLHHLHDGLLSARDAAHVDDLPLRLGGGAPAEDGLTEAQLKGFDDGAARHDPRVGRRGVELAHHVRVE